MASPLDAPPEQVRPGARRAQPAVRGAYPHPLGDPTVPPGPPSQEFVRRLIREAAQRHRVPEWLAERLAAVESNFRQSAVSPKGALGVMQLMPATARELGVDPRDLRQNIEGGMRYLRQQFERFGRWDLALAAYNAGPAAVQRHGGIPPFKETREYIRKILGPHWPLTEEERRRIQERFEQARLEPRIQAAYERMGEADRARQDVVRQMLRRGERVLERHVSGQLEQQVTRELAERPVLRAAHDIAVQAARGLTLGAAPRLRTIREETGAPALGRFGPQVRVTVPEIGEVTLQPSVEGIVATGVEFFASILPGKGVASMVGRVLARHPRLASVIQGLPLRHFLGSTALGGVIGTVRETLDVLPDVAAGKLDPDEALRRVARTAGLEAAAFGAFHAAFSGLFHAVRAGKIGLQAARRGLQALMDETQQAAARLAARRAAQARAAEARPAAPLGRPVAEPRPPEQRPAPEPAAPRPAERPAAPTEARPTPEPRPTPEAPPPRPVAERPPEQPTPRPPEEARPTAERPQARPRPPEEIRPPERPPTPEQVPEPPRPAEPRPPEVTTTAAEPEVRLRATRMVTARGTEHEADVAVVDLRRVIQSHDERTWTPRPDYQEHGGVQPRERERTASIEQIHDIAGRLRPEMLLHDSPEAAFGMPVVAPSVKGDPVFVVESGNARVAAVRLAREINPEGFRTYVQAVRERVQEMGGDPAVVDRILEQGGIPAMVRVRKTGLSPAERAAFAQEANEIPVARMSPVEQAFQDAELIRADLMRLLSPDQPIESPHNAAFVHGFVREVVPISEHATVMTAGGEINQLGVQRIKAALLAKAYGDRDLLRIMIEEVDEPVRNVTNALVAVSGRVAALQSAIREGRVWPELDISRPMAEAAKRFWAMRKAGDDVEIWLNQIDLLGADDPIMREVARVFWKFRRSSQKIAWVFREYVYRAEQAGGPAAPALPGLERTPPAPEQVLQAAVRALEEGQAVLFSLRSSYTPPRGRRPVLQGRAKYIGVAELVTALENQFDVPIRLGRYRMRAGGAVVRGQYDPRTGVVRRAVYSNLEVIYHELGHHLDHLFGIVDEAVKASDQQMLQELVQVAKIGHGPNLASYSPALWPREGLAEFVRMLFTDEARAKQVAPLVYERFWHRLSLEPGLHDALRSAIQKFRDLIGGDHWAQVMSRIVYEAPDSYTHFKPWDRLYEALVDRVWAVEKFARDVGVRGTRVDPLPVVRNFSGHVGWALAAIERGVRDKAGNLLYKPLGEIIRPVSDDLARFQAYLVALHSVELAAKGKTSGLDDIMPAVHQVIQDGDNRRWREIARQVTEWRNAVVEAMLVRTGLMSKEAAERMFAAYMHYVPFHRYFEEQGMVPLGTFRGTPPRVPIRRLWGSTRPVWSPLEELIRNTFALAQIAHRQVVWNQLVMAAKVAGRAGRRPGRWLELDVKPPVEAQRVSTEAVLEEIAKYLREAGHDPELVKQTIEELRKVMPAALVLFRKRLYPGPKERAELVVPYIRGGVITSWVQVHPDLYRAMVNLGREQATGLLRIFNVFSRVLRTGVVENPAFALFNLMRDIPQAAVLAQVEKLPYNPVHWIGRALFSASGRKDWKRAYELWLASGGSQSALVSMDRSYLQQMLRTLGRKDIGQVIKEFVTHPIEAFRALSEFTESINRVGAFDAYIRKEAGGWQKFWQLPPQHRMRILQRAAVHSREVTINFDRAGTLGQQVNFIRAFWNARVQAYDRLFRAFKKDPATITLAGLAYITVPTLVLWWVNKDRPEYQELARWRRVLFWHVPIPRPDGGILFIPVPRPFELGIIFGAIPEAVLEWAYRNNRDIAEGIVKQFTSDLYETVPVPNAAQAVVELVANYSVFRGRPIVPRAEQLLPEHLQYGPYTTETAKAIGRLLGVSPRKVEHAVRSTLGTIGYEALAAPDILIARDVRAQRIPFFRRFVVEPWAEPQSVEELYEELEKLEGQYRAWRMGRITQPPDMPRLGRLRAASRVLAQFRAMRERILADTSLTPQERSKAILDLNARIAEIARQFLAR